MGGVEILDDLEVECLKLDQKESRSSNKVIANNNAEPTIDADSSATDAINDKPIKRRPMRIPPASHIPRKTSHRLRLCFTTAGVRYWSPLSTNLYYAVVFAALNITVNIHTFGKSFSPCAFEVRNNEDRYWVQK